MTDKRPDPKPKKHPQLWQSYLWWDELVQMRKRHLLRISSASKGKSNLDETFENDILEHMQADALIDHSKKTMINYGKAMGCIWDWMTTIKGLGSGSLNAQLLAQIDDIGKFATISKLWRFAGYAVINGKREYNEKGEKSHYNRRLKSIVYLIGDQFIRQQAPVYVDIYYEWKTKYRERYPEPIKENGRQKYTDGHIDAMARRKMMKIFLQHVWLIWRETEGLPVSEPYVMTLDNHSHYIAPPNYEVQMEI